MSSPSPTVALSQASQAGRFQTSTSAMQPAPMQSALKPIATRLKSGAWHRAHSRTLFRWKNPKHIQNPGYVYDSETTYRHRDIARRVKTGPYEDRYLHHHTGILRKLIVACTDEILERVGTSTWRRTYVRKVAPLKVRIETWVVDFCDEDDAYGWEQWFMMLLRLLPASLALQFLLFNGAKPRRENGGNYAPILYHYWGDAKVWSNYLENTKNLSLLARNNSTYRVLKPRHLCFLKNPYQDGAKGMEIRNVADWERAEEGRKSNLSYIFVAYSTKQFRHDLDADKRALHQIAEAAARALKIPAYWVAVSCMQDPNEFDVDIYRIADVLRGAHSMIIAVGQSNSKTAAEGASTDALLAEWGTRMWTFPEVLLSPGQEIRVYTRSGDGDLRSPIVVSKNQFAGRVWGDFDAEYSRQLIDSYIGNLNLSRLELAVIALKCLYARERGQYLPGDQAYALMGLLRLRPQIDPSDTPFQAFARLSLANDSDKLLERYFCTLPKVPAQSWYDMTDAYDSALWDIEPYVQVAGICEEDAVILDGARGASIRWKSFFYIQNHGSRGLMMLAMNNMLVVFILMIVFFSLGGPAVIAGIIFLAIYLWLFLRGPRRIRSAYRRSFVGVQPALFGFEGYLDARTVERAISGAAFGRLTWSTNGSPLSRATVNVHGETIGVDPIQYPSVRAKVEQAKMASPGQMRVFTLVDTFNMQLTLFEAVRPPVCLFLCASEGGMQRAIGCSYDWTTQTMYRETVLRMPTGTMNKTYRASRFKIGIQRPAVPCSPAGSHGQIAHQEV
ncbi:hypothetical protein GQ53DRAFT_855744 [Thozetella sp. PMI_491]|nr:hypothetical protein GQ53DRAFT_855744 [Thozetella sp. PMI_491]